MSYSLLDLGALPGDTYGYAYDINALGDVAGASGGSGGLRATLWSAAGGMQNLENLGDFSSGCGVNDAGQVTGFFDASQQDHQPFLWTPGQDAFGLGNLGGDWGEGYDINLSGQVVGKSENEDGIERAFLWSPGEGMRDLGTLGGLHSGANAINDAGWVVGWAQTETDATVHPFLWTENGGMSDLETLGGKNSYANSINNNNQVVGSSDGRAFLWSETSGSQELLGDLGGGLTWANDINDLGVVVGLSHQQAVKDHPFIAYPKPLIDLYSMLTLGSDWSLYDIRAINVHGEIAATFFDMASPRQCILEPKAVPYLLPETLLEILLGAQARWRPRPPFDPGDPARSRSSHAMREILLALGVSQMATQISDAKTRSQLERIALSSARDQIDRLIRALREA